jgi:ribosomal protein S18 acetylase RimI-like enzyme
LKQNEAEVMVGLGQYAIEPNSHSAEIAFAVRDEYQNKGIGKELLSYLTLLAKKQGLLGFTAEVLVENQAMLHLFQEAGFLMDKRVEEQVYELKMTFVEAKSHV